MKKITFLAVALFISLQVLSQDWQTVVSNRSALFEFSGYTDYFNDIKEIRVVKIDSIAVQGSDSAFFNYQTIRDEFNGYTYVCYQLNDTGWIGSSVLVKSDGDNVFFNQYNDSIVIKTLEGVGTSWHLFELGGGNYLEANITSANAQTVLGTNDSVKTILLNAKDNLGQPIAHPMNNRILKISKQHGLLTPYRFFYFPDDTTHFEIAGITNPGSGRQLLDKRDIYNFDVGDFFQWQGDERDGSFSNWIHTCDETHVLSKNISAGGDTIVYVFDNERYRRSFFFPGPATYYYTHDTDTVTIAFPPAGILDLLPNQVYGTVVWPDYGVAEQFSDSAYYHDRRIRVQGEYLTYDIGMNCISYIIGDCTFWNYYYADGLGNVAIYDGSSAAGCIDYHMVFYQKGSETWGTMVNCPMILGESEESKPTITVFPNPFTNEVNIDWTAFKTRPVKIEIRDAAGKVVKSLTTDQSKQKISTGDLSSGFYFLSLQSGSNTFHYKLVKN